MSRNETAKIIEMIRNSNITEWDARFIIGALYKEGLIRADYIIWDSDVREAARRAAFAADVSDEDMADVVDRVLDGMSDPSAYIEMYSEKIEDEMEKEAEFLVSWEAKHGKEKAKAEMPLKKTPEERKGTDRER